MEYHPSKEKSRIWMNIKKKGKEKTKRRTHPTTQT
jgi:hypothetical protein